MVFLYKEVLKIELDDFRFRPANIGKRLSIILSRKEVQEVLSKLQGEIHLMAPLRYGSGLRLTECLNLHVKDIDIDFNEITVRAAKGDNDRRTVLLFKLIPPIRR